MRRSDRNVHCSHHPPTCGGSWTRCHRTLGLFPRRLPSASSGVGGHARILAQARRTCQSQISHLCTGPRAWRKFSCPSCDEVRRHWGKTADRFLQLQDTVDRASGTGKQGVTTKGEQALGGITGSECRCPVRCVHVRVGSDTVGWPRKAGPYDGFTGREG